MSHTETSKYTKEQLHEAFTIEALTRKQLQEQLKQAEKNAAQLRYDRDRFQDKYMMLHIKKYMGNLPDGQSIDDEIDKFFRDPTRQIYFTPSGGYYCLVQQEECVFITFAWHNPDKWRAEIRDMTSLIRSIAGVSRMPIRWSGKVNVLKNHSEEVMPGLYQLKL